MSSLHSKIGAANNNMPQAPKPAVRKFADGGAVRTRSDEEIGDTDPRTGKVDPGSYERRMAEGAKNMERLSSAADTLKSFFSRETPASASNVTGESGMSASDTAKKQAMSGGAQMPAAAEEPRRQISDYMVKKEATESEGADYGNESRRTPMPSAPASEQKVVKRNKPSMSNMSSTSPKAQPEVKMTGSPDMPSSKAEPQAKTVAKPIKTPEPAAPKGKLYRTVGGKMARAEPVVEKPLDQQWGLHNVVPNAKRYAGAVADYIKNFETPAERRSRLAKEGK